MPSAKIREEQILNFNTDVITSTLTGYLAGSGSVSSADTILGALQKIDGNDALKVPTSRTVAGFALSGNVTLANLTASTGLSGSTYNGSAGISWTIDQAFAPTWTGIHTFSLTNTASSGTSSVNFGTKIAHTVNQTSTAGFTDLLVNRVSNTPGSGTQNLLDLQNAGTSKFSVNTSGAVTANGGFFGGQSQFQFFQLSATQLDGAYIFNTASATAGAPVTIGGNLRWQGSVWNTTATAAANYYNWIIWPNAVSGTTPTTQLNIASSLTTTTTASYTTIATISQTGWLTCAGVIDKSALGTINAGATATALQMQTGWKTTSSSAVAITTATATATATQIGATGNGYTYDFIVDNSASTSVGVITITLGTGFTAMTAITGENTLTIQIGIVACFRVIFTSSTTAVIGRLI